MTDQWDCDWGEDSPVVNEPPATFHTKTFTNRSNNKPNWRESSGRNEPREPRNGAWNSNRGPPRSHQDDSATVIKVPSKFVGRIIGRGGSKINDLQFESGAKINVTKDTEGDETMVKLSGDENAVAKAESMIRELTIERDNYGGQSHNYSQSNSYSQSSNYFQNSNNYAQANDYSQSSNSSGNFYQSGPPPNSEPQRQVIDWQAVLRDSVSIFYFFSTFFTNKM